MAAVYLVDDQEAPILVDDVFKRDQRAELQAPLSSCPASVVQ